MIGRGWIYAGLLVAGAGVYWWNDHRIRQEEIDKCDLRAQASQGAADTIDKRAANQSQQVDAAVSAELETLRASNARLINELATAKTRVPIVMPSGQACPGRGLTADELEHLLGIPDR